MIDHRIRTIRFWLLSAAVYLACCVEPGWAVYFLATYAMAPLGLFMPVFGAAPSGCSACSGATSATVQVDFTGWLDWASCPNCDVYWNTTSFILTHAGGTSCIFDLPINDISGCSFLSRCLRFTYGATDNVLAEVNGACSNPSPSTWVGTGGSSQDCEAGVFSLPTYTYGAGSATSCDASASAATVTAL